MRSLGALPREITLGLFRMVDGGGGETERKPRIVFSELNFECVGRLSGDVRREDSRESTDEAGPGIRLRMVRRFVKYLGATLAA